MNEVLLDTGKVVVSEMIGPVFLLNRACLQLILRSGHGCETQGVAALTRAEVSDIVRVFEEWLEHTAD